MTRFTNRIEIGPDCFEIFLTPDDYPEMLSYGINMAGISQLRPPYLVERAGTPVHSLVFTSYGQGKLTSEQGEQSVVAETMMIIPAGCDSRFEIDSEHWNMCWILLPTSTHWNSLLPKQAEIRSTRLALNIFHLCHVIDQERSQPASVRQSSFAKLARYLRLNLTSKATQDNDRLSAAFAQVEQSLHKPWAVADLARLTFYSEPHLYRLCKERFGKSPKQMIRELRLERAKQLLIQTDWPLAELAQRLGYSDAFNFSHRFKHGVGKSPTQYRAEQQRRFSEK